MVRRASVGLAGMWGVVISGLLLRLRGRALVPSFLVVVIAGVGRWSQDVRWGQPCFVVTVVLPLVSGRTRTIVVRLGGWERRMAL